MKRVDISTFSAETKRKVPEVMNKRGSQRIKEEALNHQSISPQWKKNRREKGYTTNGSVEGGCVVDDE